jgi:hypothetical protein
VQKAMLADTAMGGMLPLTFGLLYVGLGVAHLWVWIEHLNP